MKIIHYPSVQGNSSRSKLRRNGPSKISQINVAGSLQLWVKLLWNCDSYNKLKLCGLFTYGTVDSFSRKIIWLEVCRTNSNPMDVETMYVKAAKSLKLVPEMLRTDHGNKTGVMTAAHCRLRQNTDAHRYRISVAKLRIENFWSHFRRTFTSWLVNFFKQMVDEGLLEMGNHFYLLLFFRFATNRTKRLCRTLEHTSYQII